MAAPSSPSLNPRRPSERVKTNRRDAVKLVRLYQAGELTEIWTPDEAHEAMRDLVRPREAAVKDRTRKRQESHSFLLRHGTNDLLSKPLAAIGPKADFVCHYPVRANRPRPLTGQ